MLALLTRPRSVTDVLGNVHKMRASRGGSIQTPVQYRFVHLALREYVLQSGPQCIFGTNTPREITINKVRGVFSVGWRANKHFFPKKKLAAPGAVVGVHAAGVVAAVPGRG
jgi:hypothetical protein